MIKAVVFDIGNVLLKFDFGKAVRRLQRQCKNLHPSVLEKIEPHKASYEGGLMERAEFQRIAQELLGFTGEEDEFVRAWQEIFEENTPMVSLVRQLHKKLPLYLLSNTSDLHMDYVFAEYPFFGLFKDAVYSYRAGCCKPSPTIYEVAIKQFGINPRETVFIDDLLPNVLTARGLGFEAIHYDYNRHGSTLSRLREFGLPIGEESGLPGASH